LFASVRRYWNIYGGWKALVTSSYLHLALLITAALYPLWYNCDQSPAWVDLTVNIMPSLMGFSIAGMAVMLAFSHPQTLGVITEGKEKSFFLGTIVNLIHFVVVQTTALTLAVVGKAYHHWVLNLFGTAVMIYAILLSIAAACQLFNTARIMNAAAAAETKRSQTKEKK
jgi:hypothetical protein